ncbi:MAG: peptidase S41 [Pseudomonadota bacterium]
MTFENDRARVRDAIARDPAFAGLNLSEALSDMDAATRADEMVLAAMRVLAHAGNGHSRVIPNAAIKVCPVRIVARPQGFTWVRGTAETPLETVNDIPVMTLLEQFRPLLAGTPARQSVIGAILLAWPAALGAQTVTYGTPDGTKQFGADTLVPASTLYPASETGRPGLEWDTGPPVVADGPIWRVRIARLHVPLPSPLVETVLQRPDANIVFDLRGNTGGDFTRMLPVIEALHSHWRGTRMAVQVDRFTFSAAIVAAVLLQHHLGARLFGEAMGDGLRFWAEGGTVDLPDTGAQLRWSSGWHDWETGQADATTPPEIARHMVATGPLRITPAAGDAEARAWVAG